MATKTELAAAAVQTLRNRREEVTLDAVNALIEKISPGQSVNKAVLQQATSQLDRVKPEASPPTPPKSGEVNLAIELVQLAKALVEAAGGDKAATIRLIESL